MLGVIKRSLIAFSVCASLLFICLYFATEFIGESNEAGTFRIHRPEFGCLEMNSDQEDKFELTGNIPKGSRISNKGGLLCRLVGGDILDMNGDTYRYFMIYGGGADFWAPHTLNQH